MKLDPAEFRRLEGEARRLDLADGKPYLAEAIACLRHTEDPVESLALLRALWGTGYATRPDQQKALDGVGRWLEQRLRHAPGIAAEQVALELGWLRRMAVILEHERRAARPGAGAPRDEPRGPRPAGKREPGFGRDLEDLRRAQQRALRRGSAGDQRPGPDRIDPPPPPQPQPLPAEIEVAFADVQQLRETRKLLRRKKPSKKPNKAPKERRLALRLVDAALQERMTNLCCSTTRTDGLDALFAATDANGGVPPTFHVRLSDVEEEGGSRIARRVFLEFPAVGKNG